MEEPSPPSRRPSPHPVLPPASSARARRIRWITLALVIAIVAGLILAAAACDTLPERLDRQQTLVFGQTRLAPGSESALRVIVREAKSAEPIADADVQVSLAPQEGGAPTLLYSGRSGPDGAVAASFTVPETAAITQTLVVEARSPAGHDVVRQPVTVERAYRLLLTTDKPVYQPGQVVHMRALAFSTLDMRAVAGGEVRFLVEDPKGNKVFRKTVTTSEFGVAAADLTLADEVTHGDYKVSVSLFDTTSEKTVSVRPYVLPKFAIKISTERSYYLPGERVAGTVQCDYFFDKPVADGEVEILGSVFDVEEVQVVSISGRTDAQGRYAFEFDLPEYFAGRGLERDEAEFSLQVTVTDQARHVEQASQTLPIARSPIIVEAVPEAGVLKPGVENRLYILTSYPDGRPARTRLSVAIGDVTAVLDTSDFGLAELTLTPSPAATRLLVAASDPTGRSVRREIDLKADESAGVVLLRPDRATYHVGDTMHLVALTTAGSGSLFLDIVKEGQTLSTRSQPVQDGRAEFAIDLSGDLFGTLALHAYKVLADGSIIRDTRLVVVDAPRDLRTDIAADRPTYRPGESARLTFTTHAETGPVAAALGVAIVDESVFAVMEQDPGFARLYFLLQKELLEPRYQVKGFTVPEVLTRTEDIELQLAQDRAARAAWAPVPAGGLTLAANSRPSKVEAAARARRVGLTRVANLTLVALILVPLALWVAVTIGLRATGVLGRALGRFALVVLGLTFGSPFACVALYPLLLLAQELPGGVGLALVRLVILAPIVAWLAAVIALTVYAWLRRDERTRIVWLLLVAWVGLGVLLTWILVRGAVPNEWLGALAILSYLGGLLALLLFGIGLTTEGRWAPGIAVIALVVCFVPAVVTTAMLPEVLRSASWSCSPDGQPPLARTGRCGPVLATIGDPRLYMGPLGWLTGCAPGSSSDALQGLPLPLMGGLAGKEAPRPQPTPAPTQPEAKPAVASEAPRVRQFFPETLLWLPELRTDADGFVQLDVPLADSITTWRVTALASTQDGRLGLANAALRVFQDFFVDIDLPVALTQSDEVAIPVAIYNYLPEAQEVRLEVQPEAWFELQDAPAKSIRIEANDVDVVYFRIRVLRFGEQAFQVTAYGDRMSDAIRRSVTVIPDGRLYRQSQSDWLKASTAVQAAIPAPAISGTARIEVKVYPGPVSQVVEDLERILRLPHG